jgi:hypothetical protein
MRSSTPCESLTVKVVAMALIAVRQNDLEFWQWADLNACLRPNSDVRRPKGKRLLLQVPALSLQYLTAETEARIEWRK